MANKQCRTCEQHKPITEFYQRSGKPNATCKRCQIAVMRAWQKREARIYRASQKAKNANIRARRLGIEGTLTTADVLAVFDRQSDTCLACGLVCNLTLDHVIPLSTPESANTPDNLQGLCGPCNREKHDCHIDYRDRLRLLKAA